MSAEASNKTAAKKTNKPNEKKIGKPRITKSSSSNDHKNVMNI